MLVAVPDVGVVALGVARGVGFLDRAPRGGVVAGDGQPQRRTVGVGNLLLDEPLAERTAADDRSAVVVLQRSGEDFARRGASLVDEHRQVEVGGTARAVAVLFDALVVAVFGIDDQFVGGQELVGDGDRLVEEPARIAPQVEDQFAHSLRAERRERFEQFGVRGAGELVQFDEGDVAGEHQCRREAADRDLVAHDRHLHQFVDAAPFEAQPHLRAAFAAQPAHDLALGDLLSGHQRIVDAHDAVARHDARLVARPRRNDVQHDHRVGGHVEYHADAVEFAVERFVDFGHLRGGDVDRVGVEFRNDDGQRPFDERIDGHRVDVLRLDER